MLSERTKIPVKMNRKQDKGPVQSWNNKEKRGGRGGETQEVAPKYVDHSGRYQCGQVLTRRIFQSINQSRFELKIICNINIKVDLKIKKHLHTCLPFLSSCAKAPVDGVIGPEP